VGVPRVQRLQWLQKTPPSDGNGVEEHVHAMAISMPCRARHWIHCEYIVNTLWIHCAQSVQICFTLYQWQSWCVVILL
jgi:hypothetical protein